MVMWTRPRAFYLGLSVLSFLGRVLADKTITVDGRDTSIKLVIFFLFSELTLGVCGEKVTDG